MLKRILSLFGLKETKQSYNYAVVNNHPFIDWPKEISYQIEGSWRRMRHAKMCCLAGDWYTCAVGQQTNLIPRNINGGPHDKQLQSFGLQFNNAVFLQNWSLALSVYSKIVDRVTVMTLSRKVESL